MKPMLISLLLLTCVFSRESNTAYFPKWKLEVKNEFGTEEEIVLRAGQFTKVTFVVTNENDYTFYDRFFDTSEFKIFLQDDNLVTLEESYEITPFNSLEYTTYIGLNCENQINAEEYTFTFSVEEKENSDEDTPKLNVVPTSVKIDKTPQKLTLTPVLSTLLEHSFNLVKLKEKIYNINPIVITSSASDVNSNFEEISIPEFYPLHEPKENELIFSPFCTNKKLEESKDEKEFTYHLELSSDKQCFYLNEESTELNIKVIKGEPQSFNDKTFEDFLASKENVTPEFDKTNNIQIKINVPFAPLIYLCSLFQSDSYFSGMVFIYDEILTTGEYILKFDDLQSEKEYNGMCFLSNNDETENKIENSDESMIYFLDLIPSKDFNRKPECVEFNFASNSDSNNLNMFGAMAEKYCFDVMNEGEPIQIRITGSARCLFIQDEEESEMRNKVKICARAGPFNRDLKYKKENEEVYFKRNFKKFVNNLSDGQKIEENLGLSGLIVESTNRVSYKEREEVKNEEKVFEEKEVEKEDKIEKEAEKVEEDKQGEEKEDKVEKKEEVEKDEDEKNEVIEKKENKKEEDKVLLHEIEKDEEDKVEKEEDKKEVKKDKKKKQDNKIEEVLNKMLNIRGQK